MRKGSHRSHYGQQITAEKASDSDQVHDWIKKDDGFYFMKQLRGTPAYWRTVKYDAVAMVRQLGIPTWFLTLSAADLHWYDTLAPLFQLQYGRIPTEEEVTNLSGRDRCHLLRSHPVTAVRLCNQKINAFFSKVLKGSQQPLRSLPVSENVPFSVRKRFPSAFPPVFPSRS